ncbi:unnamed protein product [Notodromas monacha]|uniref:DNA ligase n=1 Tax=Notodromas monacha TaxID=399045 RepID=A0A7R9BF96_9CRUS|nr:unnamed protein product [Notodromas monacha]CAG0913738.1 unnamed protein product [Notodromas monacha]
MQRAKKKREDDDSSKTLPSTNDSVDHVKQERSKNEDVEVKLDQSKRSKNVVPIKSDCEETKVNGEQVSPEDYDPKHTNYKPIKHACWKRGAKQVIKWKFGMTLPYLALARTLAAMEDTKGRLKVIEYLSNYFRSVLVLTPEDLLPSVYLVLGQLGPAWEGAELGVGEGAAIKLVAEVTGRSAAKIRQSMAEIGDLGQIAESSKSSQKMMFKPAALSVRNVYEAFVRVSKLKGKDAVKRKCDDLKTAFVASQKEETRFIARMLLGKMRIGFGEESMLQAIGLAVTKTPPLQEEYPPSIMDNSKKLSSSAFDELLKSQVARLKRAYCECPSYDLIIPLVWQKGIDHIEENVQLSPGVPVKPMLAHPTKGIEEVLQRFQGHTFACEFKYDGERAQIHLSDDGTVNVFSRNQEDNTGKYPDIIARFKGSLKSDVKSCIMDSEAVAFDTEIQSILPFQVLSTRKKKGAELDKITVQVCVYAFDLLFLNGESLVRLPFKERREKLRQIVVEKEGEFALATCRDTGNVDEIQEFLDEAVKSKCEGLMIKTLEEEASYEISKRSLKWLKLKKDYLDGVGDTLDLVPIGGFLGKGKRTGFYGGFLLAVYDPENEEYQSICKIGTGFTDEYLEKHATFFKDHVIPSPKSYYRYDSSVEPDHWFEVAQVWEVKCADLSLSPNHQAAIGRVEAERGISLRFPRFLKIRDDKNPEDATTASQV